MPPEIPEEVVEQETFQEEESSPNIFGHFSDSIFVLTGEIDRPSTGRVEPVRGCLNNPSRLEWTTLTSLTAPLAALRSSMKTRERIDLS
jgi:hypothetical protein